MVAYKVVKTPLGDVYLGVECGKIVWCGFERAAWAQNGVLTCPVRYNLALRAQKDTKMFPRGWCWAHKDTQMCPEEDKCAVREQIPAQTFPEGSLGAFGEQICPETCPERADGEGEEQNCPEMFPMQIVGIPEYSLEELLRGRGSIFRWEDLQLWGTPLQLRVWRELFNLLPYELITYSELAARCGYPNAVRAVATAVGKNPISLIIPCHRVVRKRRGRDLAGNKGGSQIFGSRCGCRISVPGNSKDSCAGGSMAVVAEGYDIGNYRWGKEIKIKILEWEGII